MYKDGVNLSDITIKNSVRLLECTIDHDILLSNPALKVCDYCYNAHPHCTCVSADDIPCEAAHLPDDFKGIEFESSQTYYIRNPNYKGADVCSLCGQEQCLCKIRGIDMSDKELVDWHISLLQRYVSACINTIARKQMSREQALQAFYDIAVRAQNIKATLHDLDKPEKS
jgi:hypothetical protein